MEVAVHTGQYEPKELEHFESVLNAAVDDARRLGISFDTPDEALWLRTRMATAIFGGAASGERDAGRLRSQAVAMILGQGVTVLEACRAADDGSSRTPRRLTSVTW